MFFSFNNIKKLSKYNHQNINRNANWLMKLKKIIHKAILIITSALLLSSCGGEPYCINANEFDSDTALVNSKTNSIFGFYNNSNGGQIMNWQETGYQTNGMPLIIKIDGGWNPWGSKINKDCTFCSKFIYKEGNANVSTGGDNCVCPAGIEPQKETDAPAGTDCTKTKDQQDSGRCTCRKAFSDDKLIPPITTAIKNYQGVEIEINFKHFALDYFNKNEEEKIIKGSCYYRAGMGLFLGFFDNNGVMASENPYHLFSQEEVCDVVRTNGKCLDSAGQNIASYIYRIGDQDSTSLNVKNPPLNKTIKMTINDSYYSDNLGSYSVTFLQGIMKYKESGLLENLVIVFEDIMLGKVNSNGKREGGFVKGIYNGIVQSSVFIRILQICLSLYIVFFGISVIMGVVEVGKKELLQRILKLGLVIFFINPTSWINYESYVITFFKDGLDYLVNMVMTAYDYQADKSSLSEVAKMSRDQSIGNSTRFAFADIVIKALFSSPVSKKIYGLFYASPIGFIVILMIYASIIFFIFVMLTVAMFYVVNLIKLVIALALGPIFIVFSLFSKTQDNFKKWLSFLATRSFEILVLFLVAYSFTLIIDKEFKSMLSFRSCLEEKTFLWFLKYNAWKSYPSFSSFSPYIFKIVLLSYITLMITNKIPAICGEIISVGGVFEKEKGSSSGGSSALGMMFSAVQGIQSIGKSAISESAQLVSSSFSTVFSSENFLSISNILSYPAQALKGLSKYLNNYANNTNSTTGKFTANVIATPFRLGSAILNAPATISKYFNDRQKNALIDDKMNKLEAESKDKNMDSVSKEKFFRKEMVKFAEDNDFINRGFGRNANDMKLINKKLADKFINKDMKNRAKELSSQGMFGESLKNQLQKEFGNKSLFDPRIFGAVAEKSSKENARKYLQKKGFSNDDIDMYKSYKKSLKNNSSLSNNRKEITNYFKSYDVDSVKEKYNKERDSYILAKESLEKNKKTNKNYKEELKQLNKRHDESIKNIKQESLDSTINSKSDELLKYKKELRDYNNKTKLVEFDLIKGPKTNISDKISFSTKKLPFFSLEKEVKRDIKKDISKTIEKESKKDTLLSKIFKYKKDSSSAFSKAIDGIKSYFSTGEALKNLKEEFQKKKTFDDVMDKFVKDYEKRKSENIQKYQNDYQNEIVDNIYIYINNNKDNLPKDLQEQLKGFEIGGDNKLEINNKVGIKEFMGAEKVETGLKGVVDPLLGGSEGKEGNEQEYKQKTLEEQKKKAEETQEKLKQFEDAMNENANNKPNN